jgi:hypothetical protein
MTSRSNQERLAVVEAQGIQANTKIDEIKDNITELDSKLGDKIDDIKDLIIEQNSDIRKELADRPKMTTWLSVLLIFFGLAAGSYGYTRMETTEIRSTIGNSVVDVKYRMRAAEKYIEKLKIQNDKSIDIRRQ